jgi:hypothetical protein
MGFVGSSTPDQLKNHLIQGETIVWWGRPAQGIVFAAADALLIPFSLVWGGFAIFWETLVLRGKAPLPFALFGVPFVLVGLFLIFGRFFLDSWLRARTVYALTDRRVLIARAAPFGNFKAVNLDRLPEVSLIEKANGKGTIRFGQPTSMFGATYGVRRSGGWIAALDPTPQFFAIDDVQRVFAAVQERSQGHLR